MRDMCMRKNKYGDFQSSPEGIPTNILANRLKTLEGYGIIKKRPYQQSPLRYEYLLTAKGADLLNVIQQLALWAEKYVPECGKPPEWFLTLKSEDIMSREP